MALATTADIKIGWTFPTGLTMDWGGIAYTTSEAFTGFGGLDQTTVPAFGGTGSAAHLFGTVVVSSTAGTLQLQQAQNVMNASNTIVAIGTHLVLHRVS